MTNGGMSGRRRRIGRRGIVNVPVPSRGPTSGSVLGEQRRRRRPACGLLSAENECANCFQVRKALVAFHVLEDGVEQLQRLGREVDHVRLPRPSKLVAKISRVSSSNGRKRAAWMTATGSA
jgi:hypothetical protein